MGEHLAHGAGLHREPDGDTGQFGAQGAVLTADSVQVVDDGVLGCGGEGGAQGRTVVRPETVVLAGVAGDGRVHGGRRCQGAVAGAATVGRPALFGDLTRVGGLRPHV